MRYMFDTDICIYAMKGRSAILAERLPQLAEGDACISVVAYGELLVGAEKSIAKQKMLDGVKRMVDILAVMPLDEDVAGDYARIRSHLERKGTPIGANDLWIGAHALALGLTLITNNDREFKRIPKLKVENWTK